MHTCSLSLVSGLMKRTRSAWKWSMCSSQISSDPWWMMIHPQQWTLCFLVRILNVFYHPWQSTCPYHCQDWWQHWTSVSLILRLGCFLPRTLWPRICLWLEWGLLLSCSASASAAICGSKASVFCCFSFVLSYFLLLFVCVFLPYVFGVLFVYFFFTIWATYWSISLVMSWAFFLFYALLCLFFKV